MNPDHHAQEHDVDPHDVADAYFLLDDGEARLGLSECCGKHICGCDPDREFLKSRRYRHNPYRGEKT